MVWRANDRSVEVADFSLLTQKFSDQVHYQMLIVRTSVVLRKWLQCFLSMLNGLFIKPVPERLEFGLTIGERRTPVIPTPVLSHIHSPSIPVRMNLPSWIVTVSKMHRLTVLNGRETGALSDFSDF